MGLLHCEPGIDSVVTGYGLEDISSILYTNESCRSPVLPARTTPSLLFHSEVKRPQRDANRSLATKSRCMSAPPARLYYVDDGYRYKFYFLLFYVLLFQYRIFVVRWTHSTFLITRYRFMSIVSASILHALNWAKNTLMGSSISVCLSAELFGLGKQPAWPGVICGTHYYVTVTTDHISVPLSRVMWNEHLWDVSARWKVHLCSVWKLPTSICDEPK